MTIILKFSSFSCFDNCASFPISNSVGINSNFLHLFFGTKVEVTALPSYEEKEEQFEKEVTC